MRNSKIILVFDIDGVLTKARSIIDNEMKNYIKKLSDKYIIATLGGSDFVKQKEQLSDSIQYFDLLFSENGTIGYKKNDLITPFYKTVI